ncbi:MAG: hypothetical protein M1530_01100 [Candidatus Marsarchaeota archaeon]|nr:hypothetical protein [Candidatus Marsarchaeota archaeon]
MAHVTEPVMKRLIDLIPDDKPVSVHSLTCKTGLNYRTLRKYVELIVEIQSARKVVQEQVGLRVLVRRNRN